MREHTSREVDRLAAGGSLGDDLHLVLRVDQCCESTPHRGLIVGNDHADHGPPYGRPASTRNPCASARALTLPPTAAARSLMPRMPTPGLCPFVGSAVPSPFSTVTPTRSCLNASVTCT